MPGWGRYCQQVFWRKPAAISLKRGKIGPWLLVKTNRKSHTHFRLVPKSTTLDDLERQSVSKYVSFRSPTWIWMKIDPHWRRCSPMTLVTGNIRFMRIFAPFRGRSLERGSQTTVGLSKTTFFSTFARYFFRRFRDKANIMRPYYLVPRHLSTGPIIRDLEWSWTAILVDCVIARLIACDSTRVSCSSSLLRLRTVYHSVNFSAWLMWVDFFISEPNEDASLISATALSSWVLYDELLQSDLQWASFQTKIVAENVQYQTVRYGVWNVEFAVGLLGLVPA